MEINDWLKTRQTFLHLEICLCVGEWTRFVNILFVELAPLHNKLTVSYM